MTASRRPFNLSRSSLLTIPSNTVSNTSNAVDVKYSFRDRAIPRSRLVKASKPLLGHPATDFPMVLISCIECIRPGSCP